MKPTFIVLMMIAVALEVIADILFKYWSVTAKNLFLWAGIVLYVIGTVMWASSLKFENLSKAIIVFTVANLILVVLAGVFIFNEHLSLLNKIGILLGIVSVILVQI